MPFLRPGQVAAFASPTPKFNQLGLLTLFSLSAAVSASAKTPKISKVSKTASISKPVGVQAWTSGSQTFIRARPGANVPPVAKLARHTPIYVWGKYKGWYRVETHDHIFGWVFNQYLNAPGLEKIAEMPRYKAKVASNRTANQVMYGTPEMLKKHYLTYGAPGALVGLKKQGVYLAASPKPAVKPKTFIVSTSKAKMDIAPKTRLAAVPRVRERITVQPLTPRVVTPRSVSETVSSPVPVVEPRENLTPVTAIAPVPVQAPRVETTPEPRDVDSDRIATAGMGASSSARLFARNASATASTPTEDNSANPDSPVALAPVTPVVTKPVIVKPVAAPAPKPAPKRVAAKPVRKKTVAKSHSKSRYAALRDKKRQELRLQMGLSPKSSPPSVIAPVSPAELMKAREEYLNERKARLNAPATPGAPAVGSAPLPATNGTLGGPGGNALSPTPPAGISPTAFHSETSAVDESQHPLYALMNAPEVVALAKLKPQAVCAPLPSRGGSPRDRAPLPRGGSPRDRMASGMANQALSYRGMPYIRGAASPSRGFDCSGLIYFLLRQRGYNPPRTAAGYKNWGTGVPRGQWQPGDLVLFANTYKRGISHIGVYLGNGKFVHAATSRTGVMVSSLSEAYYSRKYYGARRIK